MRFALMSSSLTLNLFSFHTQKEKLAEADGKAMNFDYIQSSFMRSVCQWKKFFSFDKIWREHTLRMEMLKNSYRTTRLLGHHFCFSLLGRRKVFFSFSYVNTRASNDDYLLVSLNKDRKRKRKYSLAFLCRFSSLSCVSYDSNISMDDLFRK